MMRFELNEFNKKQIAIILFIVVVLLAGQFYLVRQIKAVSSELKSANLESRAINTTFQIKTDTVALYKSALNLDHSAIPIEVESPTKFYSILINILTKTGINGAAVVNVSESPDLVSFKVSGEVNYFTLLNLLSEFRKSRYMIKLSELNLSALTDGYVSYLFVVESKISGVVISPGINSVQPEVLK